MYGLKFEGTGQLVEARVLLTNKDKRPWRWVAKVGFGSFTLELSIPEDQYERVKTFEGQPVRVYGTVDEGFNTSCDFIATDVQGMSFLELAKEADAQRAKPASKVGA